MINLDGTRQKTNLGANAMLAVSMAVKKLSAIMPPYNLIPTTILCSRKKPAINIRTGEDFTENDPPLLVATSEEIIRETDKNNGDYLMRAVRRKKDGKYEELSKSLLGLVVIKTEEIGRAHV